MNVDHVGRFLRIPSCLRGLCSKAFEPPRAPFDFAQGTLQLAKENEHIRMLIPLLHEIPNFGVCLGQHFLLRQEDDPEMLRAGLLSEA